MHMRSGKTRSCGCLRKERQRAAVTTHGKTSTRAYFIYNAMKDRCYREGNRNFHNYGGRGIRVCRRWLGPNGFNHFLADMGEPPPDHSIERRRINENYTPTNCFWLPRRLQSRNKRNTIRVWYAGRKVTLTELVEITGICQKTLYSRYAKGLRGLDLVVPLKE